METEAVAKAVDKVAAMVAAAAVVVGVALREEVVMVEALEVAMVVKKVVAVRGRVKEGTLALARAVVKSFGAHDLPARAAQQSW